MITTKITGEIMNKSELIDAVSEQTGLTKAATTRALNALMEQITDELSRGEQVILPGFGTFSVGHRAARTGRNPRTGEEITIDAAKVAKFKAGKALKDAVQGEGVTA